MSRDAQELANELYERFGALTKEYAPKIAAIERLPITPMPTEAVKRAVEQAAARLLSEYPFTAETMAGWDAFLRRKKSFEWAFEKAADAALQAQEKPQAVGKTDYIIEENAKNAAAPLASNAEKEEARPDREALRQYIDMRFALYAQKEGKDKEGKSYSYFVDLQGRGKGYNNKPNAAIRTEAELDAALSAGITLYHFSPKERGFLCIDVDCGHEGGADGFENVRRWLETKGFAKGYNPLNEARVYVDTPSGGRHYYFAGKEKCLAKIPGLDSVDVFGEGTGATLTAAGSVKKGKVYRLHGRLEDATPINAAFLGYLANDEYAEQAREAEREKAKANAKPSAGSRFKSYTEHTLAEKVDYYAANCPKAGRNNAAHYCALRLGWQSSFNELYAAMRAHPELGTLPDGELRTAIQSGMSKSRKL